MLLPDGRCGAVGRFWWFTFGDTSASVDVGLLGCRFTACWLGATGAAGWAQRKKMVMPWAKVAELLERPAAGPGGPCEDRADSGAGATFGVVFTDPVRRQPESVQLGARGETAVKLELEKLGWGVVMIPREHDLGRDLFALVRDDRLFDLNLMLVAQVKTGPSYFKAQHKNEAGEVDGWWFVDEGRENVDGWLEHVLPHVVVLHNHLSGNSYWAPVTPDAVVSTGKGAKILVPRDNLIDLAHRSALTDLAATVRPAPRWEGSAWVDTTRVPPRDLLRHALLVPRLVAPHRNAGLDESVLVEQVVALLIEARLREVDRLAKIVPGFVAREQASESADWMWKFIGALNERMTTGAVESLVSVGAMLEICGSEGKGRTFPMIC